MTNDSILLKAEGTNGKIELLENVIRIYERSKSGVDVVKEIHIKDIKNMKLKKKGLTDGNIAFDYPGAPFLGGKIINFSEERKDEFIQLEKEIQKMRGISADESIGDGLGTFGRNIKKIMQKRGLLSTNVIAAAEGINGQIILTDNGIIIGREGLGGKIFSGYTKGEKFISYKSITGVQFKEPGMTWGYIQLTLPGGIESRGGSWDASKDENTVTFEKPNLENFRRIRSIIEEKQGLGSAQMPITQAAPRTGIAEELTKLAALKNDGAITEEEFVQLKKDLFGRH